VWAEEGEAVPQLAGGGAHRGAQWAVQPALIFETVLADQPGARQAQWRIRCGRDAGLGAAALVGFAFQEVLGRSDAQAGVVGDLERALAGALGHAARKVGPWICHAMRRNRNCVWFERVCSPKTRGTFP
jgi:hypothetical protein